MGGGPRWTQCPADEINYRGVMAISPREALGQLRQERDQGTLVQFCSDHGIDLLVAFGSAVDPVPSAPPRDLDLAVYLAPGRHLLDVIQALSARTGLAQLDVLDLARAGSVARVEALGQGELLAEQTPGVFAEAQIHAVLEHADTAWIRDLQLQALAR